MSILVPVQALLSGFSPFPQKYFPTAMSLTLADQANAYSNTPSLHFFS